MRPFSTRLVPSFLLLALPMVAAAQFTFVTNNGGLTVNGYTGPGGVVVIPSATNGYLVTSIGTNAFYGATSLVSVALPGSILTVGDWAFADCGNLTNLTLSDGVTELGNYAFMNCLGLAALTLPDTVTNLGLEAFAGCENLSGVNFGAGALSIGDSAFRDCFALTSANIPNGVVSVGSGAFSVCTRLTNVVIGSGVTNIGGGAFLDCPSLMAITVDDTNPAYRTLNGVLFNKSQTYLEAYPAGQAGSYRIPDGVTLIAGDAFGACLGLTGVTIPKGVTNIIGPAFGSCVGLTNITLPASLTFLGGGAFGNCTNLDYVFFAGNAPATIGPMPVFSGLKSNATGYYLPGKMGWGSSYSGLPITLWNPQVQTGDGSFGVRAQQFGFTITGGTNLPLVVEACTNPAGASWASLQTCALTNGSVYFSDPQWMSYPKRFYRIRSP